LEKERAQAQNWREANKDRHSLNNKIWKQLNPSMNAKNASSKRVKKLQATPNWLTAIHHAQIQEMYDVAVARTVQTGIRHHVDHIFPLQGKTFSGLHVPWNLQVLTEFDNLSKKNKFPREYLELSWESV
jgi:5-methylcytosine-specific restriction endonuclease McrA